MKDTSDTFIIFNQYPIKNIRFILFGDNDLHQQPLEENWNLNDILKSRENSITLFYATNLENPRSIESSHYIPFESGAFGEGVHLFNTIEDALKHPFLKDVSVPDAKIGMNFEPVMKIDFDEQKEIKTNFFNDIKQKDLKEDEVGQSAEEEIKINNKNFNNIKISHRCASPRAIENPFYTINKI